MTDIYITAVSNIINNFLALLFSCRKRLDILLPLLIIIK